MKDSGRTICKNRATEEWWHNTGSLETGTMSKEYTGERLGNKVLINTVGQYT